MTAMKKNLPLTLFVAILFTLSACKVTDGVLTTGKSDNTETDLTDSGGNNGGSTGNTGGNNNNGSGTDGEDDDSGVIPTMLTEDFIQDKYTDRYDFLWVVDNSGSMSNIHDFMRQKLNDLVTILESRQNLDWQMAVTNTDHKYSGGNLISSASGVRVVHKDLANPSGEWASIIDNIVGTPYSGWEQGLESGYAALSNYGGEFSRPNTPLIISYISDEEDYSCESNCNNFSGLPENQTGWVAFPTNRYKSQLETYAQTNGADVVTYPIVHLQPLGVVCADDYGFVGTRYVELQSSMGKGASLSLCQQDLEASFNAVAQLTANLAVCFNLNYQLVSQNGMVVKVNGTAVQPSSSDGYEYDSDANAVCFNGSYIPTNGSTVQVTYLGVPLP